MEEEFWENNDENWIIIVYSLFPKKNKCIKNKKKYYDGSGESFKSSGKSLTGSGESLFL